MQPPLSSFSRSRDFSRRLLPWWIVTLAAPALPAAPASEGIALAIVFDTSGSMNRPMPTGPGASPRAKLAIARRSLGAVINRLEAFTRGPAARHLSVGIYVFRGNDAAVAVPMSAFNAARLRAWLEKAGAGGPTPLGAAISLAGQEALRTSAASRHLLVLTDGANSVGPRPEATLAQLNAAAARQQRSLFTHVIALDIEPDVFSALKRQGATLIGAFDESQLNEQFDFILDEKILVEAPRTAR
jgi:hypothetical protein